MQDLKLLITQLVARWYQDSLAGYANRAPEAQRVQIEQAVARLPADIAEETPPWDAAVDTWFHEHLRKAPVAHNTELYNHLFAAKEELQLRLIAVESDL